jgi:hypothetical protein
MIPLPGAKWRPFCAERSVVSPRASFQPQIPFAYFDERVEVFEIRCASLTTPGERCLRRQFSSMMLDAHQSIGD